MSERFSVTQLVMGGLSLAALTMLLLGYLGVFSRPTLKASPIQVEAEADSDSDSDSEEEEEVEEEAEEEAEEQQAESAAAPTKTIDDEAAAKAELKKEYDNLSRKVQVYIQSSNHQKAAELLTRMIEMKMASPKDRVALYNNRSAMREKLGLYRESIADIDEVLKSDPKHLKAVTRKARVLEAMGNKKDALVWYLAQSLLEQVNGTIPTSMTKVQVLSRFAAADLAKERFAVMREVTDRALPAPSVSQTYFELGLNYYSWVEQYKTADAPEDGPSAVKSAVAEFEESKDVAVATRAVEAAVKLAQYYIVLKKFQKAYDILKVAEKVADATKEVIPTVTSTLFEMLATFEILKFSFEKSIVAAKKALEIDPTNFDAEMKLAYVEGFELPTVAELEPVNALLTKYSAEDAQNNEESALKRAAVLFFRSGFWVIHNVDGMYPEGGVDKAIADLQESWNLLDVQNSPAAVGFKIMVIVRKLMLKTQAKAQVMEGLSEDERKEHNELVEELTQLDENHEMVVQSKIDACILEERMEDALTTLDSFPSMKNTSRYYTLKGSILCQKLMMGMGDASMVSAVEECFTTAIEMDRTAEYLLSYGNFQMMLQNPEFSKTLQDAAELCRTVDELQEVMLMQLTPELQMVAASLIGMR